MNARHGLIVGGVMTAMVAMVLAIVPATWLAGMLDVSGDDVLAAKLLYPESFADAVPPVLDAALTFFMSHKCE